MQRDAGPNPSLTRRPIAARNTRWASTIAAQLAKTGLRPNQISILSIVCAAIAGACLAAVPFAGKGASILLLIGAAAGIQLRLLCNLFDGMVAVEGGRRSKSGEIYNELPDRISDALILVCAGYATSWIGWEPVLGWAAALLAVLTAYVRSLGAQAGASQQFCGPMAKQQRMFIITATCLLTIGEIVMNWPRRTMTIALAVVALGSLVTALRRARRIVVELESR